MPLDGDNVTGLVGTAVTAAVGLGVVKMTTDMVSGMADTNPKTVSYTHLTLTTILLE